jgi:metallophosphoesterase superfamily enzyme
MVRYPSSAVRFVYLPKMNACLNSDEFDGMVIIVPLSNDLTVGTAVANNRIHTNIPAISYFMVLFPLVTNMSGVCYPMDSYLNVWKR